MDVRITAHHEAAHAVVNYRVKGFAGGEISIVPQSDHGVLGSAADGLSESTSAEDIEARILSCYAGGHAQRIVDPSSGADGCDEDDRIADELLVFWCWQRRDQKLRERALELVRHHWTEIVAVADELQRVQVLDNTEVEIIADFAAGDPAADLAAYRLVGGDSLGTWRKAATQPKGGARHFPGPDEGSGGDDE